MSLARIAVLAAAIGAGAACGATVREVVRDGLDESMRSQNWQKLREPARALAAEITQGVLQGGGSADLGPRLDASIDRFVRVVLHATSQELDTELSPALARSVRSSVEAAMAAILNDGTEHRLERMTEALATAAITATARGMREQLGPAIAAALDQSLGPALQRAIEDHVGPAIATTLQRDLAPVLVDLARRTSAAAAQGAVDGAHGRVAPALAELHTAVDQAGQDAREVARCFAIAVLGGLIGILAIALWLRHRSATAARDALHLVTTEIGRVPDDAANQALAARIKVASEGTRAGAYLASQLRRHPSVKLKPATSPVRPISDLPHHAEPAR